MIEKAIYELLQGEAGGRVYVMQAAQYDATPFIVYQRTDGERVRSVNGPSGLSQVSIQVDIYDDSYYACKTQAAAVEAILDGYQGTVSIDGGAGSVRVASVSLQNEFDILDQTDDPALNRVTMSYLVMFE